MPYRIFDTRSNPTQLLGVLTLQLTDTNGAPLTGYSAVALNVTVVDAADSGYITVWPCASAQPEASNLNYVAGQTVPNAVIAPIDANGGSASTATRPPT